MEPPGVSPRRLSAALFESNSGSNLLINTPLQPRQVLREDNAAPSKDITKSAPQQQTLLSLWTANPLRHRPQRGRREEEERGEGGQLRVRRGLHRGAPSIARGAVERVSGAHLMSTSRPAEQLARYPTSRSPPATQDQQPKTPSKESAGRTRPATTTEARVNMEQASAINTSARLPPKARRTPRGRQPQSSGSRHQREHHCIKRMPSDQGQEQQRCRDKHPQHPPYPVASQQQDEKQAMHQHRSYTCS